MSLKKILIVATIFLFSCEPTLPQKQTRRSFLGRSEEAIPVMVQEVALQEIPYAVKGRGRTEAADRFPVKAPEGGGRIKTVTVQEGQQINKGDSLVLFDDEAIRSKMELARSEIEEAEAGLEEAKLQEKNKEALLAQEKMTDEEAEGIDERIKLYESTLERARKQIAVYENQLEKIQLTSPISGQVTKKQVVEEEKVDENQILMEIISIDPLRFSFEIPLEAVSSLQLGDRLNVKFSALQNREFAGEIASIGAESGSSGQVQIKLTLPNETLALKTEMEGEVVLNTKLKKKAALIPENAVIQGDHSSYVYKVVGNRTRKVSVSIEGGFAGKSGVTRGLQQGDLVVVSNPEEIRDGALVEVQQKADL